MTLNMNARRLARKCSRKHAHVRIQGKFTKPSAAYCKGLAKALANVFAMHLALEVHSIKVDELEDVLTNDVLFELQVGSREQLAMERIFPHQLAGSCLST